MGADTPGGGMVQEITLFSPGPSIYGGTDQVQRNIIGERVLGLPKEPGPAEGDAVPRSARQPVDVSEVRAPILAVTRMCARRERLDSRLRAAATRERGDR